MILLTNKYQKNDKYVELLKNLYNIKFEKFQLKFAK